MKRLGLGDLGAGRRKDATHASEKIEGLVDFPTTRPKLRGNCPGCEMPNYCVLKQNYLQLNSEFKPIYKYNKLIYSINLLFLFVYTPRKSVFLS